MAVALAHFFLVSGILSRNAAWSHLENKAVLGANLLAAGRLSYHRYRGSPWGTG